MFGNMFTFKLCPNYKSQSNRYNKHLRLLTSAKKCNLSRCWQAKSASNNNEAGPGSKFSQVFGCFNIVIRLSKASDLFQNVS